MSLERKKEAPKVSVCLITYNHAPYIRECLDSILMQQTTFPYEICIGEDESTDGTREICIEYAEKYPERIRLILRSQSEPGREAYAAQGNYNYVETLKICRGTYFADVDGDDAWLDPLKLQKQFDVLEANSNVCLVHSDCALYLAGYDTQVSPHIQRDYKRSHTLDSSPSHFMYNVLLSRYKIMTCTVFTRGAAVLAVIDAAPELFQNYANGDVPLWCELTRHGSFFYIDEPLSVYRVLIESCTHSKNPATRLGYYNQNEDLKLHLARKYGLPTMFIRRQKTRICNRLAMVSGNWKEIQALYRTDPSSFSFREQGYFKLSQVPLFRAILCWLYRRLYALRLDRPPRSPMCRPAWMVTR